VTRNENVLHKDKITMYTLHHIMQSPVWRFIYGH